MRGLQLLAALLIVFGAESARSASGELKPAPERDGVFLGSASCQSSSCHGGAGEKRSQFITWSRQDFHTRAYAILLDARSARIAEAVGIGAAQTSARCTVCHSPFQSLPGPRVSSTARQDEGVSCENCHGAASGWLRGHTRSDWTYAMRVSAGMHDLRSLYVRANACVACHQTVDKDILAAGHPTLVFELDGQSVNEPKHWKDEGSWSGARAWLTGQAVALREAAWHSRSDADPSPDAQETALALAWCLTRSTLTEPTLPKVVEPAAADLEPLQREADDLARAAPNWNPSVDSVVAMLRNLGETDPEFVVTSEHAMPALYYRARRLILALDRLVAALNQNRDIPLKLEKELAALHDDVASGHGSLDLARFTGHLRALRAKL